VTSEPALRASDAERERTVALLRRHSVDGRLTLEEFSERIGRAYEAKTREELEELTRDLPAESAAVPAPRRKRTRWVVSVMGGVNRRGRFRLGARLNILAVMGGVNVDLRQAELELPEVTVNVFAFMGGTNVVVPERVEVELTGLAIMGAKAYRPGSRRPPPGAPLIRVRAIAFMGGVSVITRRDSS
jgi:uncharacterized protein DUF1707/cell wall-active antibiotic response 4TMS protein YvqF